jgi:hypothetical protein
MSPFRRAVTPSLLALVATASGACDQLIPLSDLRPPALRESAPLPKDVERGRAVLAEAATAHGGHLWRRHDTWEVVLEDRWSDDWWIARRSPWPDGATWLKFQFAPGSSDGRVEFLDGPEQGTIWGLAGGRTYAVAPGGPVQWGKADRMASRLPTMQFLIEFPQRITEAEWVTYVGKQDLEGRTVDVVFASWGTTSPDPTYDQFLVYVDQETRHIAAMQYTVRKSGRTLVGHRFWSDLRPVDGVLIPYFQTSRREFDRNADVVHSFYVRELAFDTVSAKELHPK